MVLDSKPSSTQRPTLYVGLYKLQEFVHLAVVPVDIMPNYYQRMSF
jgi:hypothetical protein